MTKFFSFFQRYGLIIILLNCWDLLAPDLSPKATLTEFDLDFASESRSGSNLFKQLSWVLPLLIYILALMKDGVDLRVTKYKLILLIGFSGLIVVCFSSVLWSDYPILTIKRVVFQLVFISTLALGVFCSIKSGSFLSCVNFLFYLVLVVCIVAIFNGSGFQGGALLGWANSKNNFGGYILSLAALFCISKFYYKEDLKGYWFKLTLLFLLLVASASKTSIVIAVFLLASGFIPYALSKFFFAFLMVVFCFLFLLIPVLSSWLGSYWDVSFLMEPETLTGRGIIWDSLYYGMSSYGDLLTGHGYGAYFGTGVIPYALDDTWSYIRFLNSAHNGYVELLLQLGAMLSLLVMFILYRLVCYAENSVCFLVAAIILIHNITESSIMRDQHVIWSLLVLLICIGIFSRERKMIETITESES